ncbi:MAG: hypothetical protein QXT63_07180 [Thermoplasmata archaeon]
MASRKRDGKNRTDGENKNELNLMFDRDAEQLVIGYTREVISKLKYPELAMQIGKDLAPMMGAAAYLLSLKHPHETITEKDVKRVEHHLGNAYLFAHRLNKAYARRLAALHGTEKALGIEKEAHRGIAIVTEKEIVSQAFEKEIEKAVKHLQDAAERSKLAYDYAIIGEIDDHIDKIVHGIEKTNEKKEGKKIEKKN